MNQSLILDLLENNARLTSQDLADKKQNYLWLSHNYQLQ